MINYDIFLHHLEELLSYSLLNSFFGNFS